MERMGHLENGDVALERDLERERAREKDLERERLRGLNSECLKWWEGGRG